VDSQAPTGEVVPALAAGAPASHVLICAQPRNRLPSTRALEAPRRRW